MKSEVNLLKTTDVTKQLRISSATLERWIRKGILAPAVKEGRTRRWTQGQIDSFCRE